MKLSAMLFTTLFSYSLYGAVSGSVGEAVTDDGILIYKERGSVQWEKEAPLTSETEYFSPEGKLIARLTADMKGDTFVPDFRLEDFRSSRWYACRRLEAGRVELSRGEGEKKEVEILSLADEMAAAGPGALFLALANFSTLLEGKEITAKVIAPAYLDFFHFDLERGKLTKEILDVEMSPSSFFLRIFAPTVHFRFHPETKRLLSYRGPALIPDQGGDTPIVTVEYEEIPETL